MSESRTGPRNSKARRKENPNDQQSSNRNRSKDPQARYEQVIFRDWCKACGICSAFCPKKVIGRDESGSPVVEKPEACIGCRFCELHCPDFAITVRERENGSEGKHNES